MKNEKRKKGKVRCLSVLLTGCLLLSVMPATAFATEDTTVAAEDKDTIAEKTQMSEQESTPGENRTEESVTDESTVKDGSSEEKVDTCNAYASGIKVNTTVRNNFTDIITNETIRTYINGIVTVDGDLSSMNGSILTTALMVLCQPLQHLKVEKNMCIALC